MAGVLTLGGKGKGPSLSSASVFELACRRPPPLLLKLDPCVLAKLSSSSSSSSGLQQNASSSSSSASFKFKLRLPDYLTLEESRASLLLLLNKLLLGGSSSSSSSSSAASQLLDALNNFNTDTREIDLDLSRKNDHDLLNNCWLDAALHGICALLDYTASSLATIADAVASLSFEALKADVSTAFNFFTDTGDGSSDKDRVAVASDFKVLLNGSKLLGNLQTDLVIEIPIVHGRLRSLSRSFHSSTRVEINSIPIPIPVNGRGRVACEGLTGFISSLAYALENLGERSWLRAKLCLDNMVKENLFPSLVETFSTGCPEPESLRASIMSFVAAKSNKDYISSVHEVYTLAEAVRKILSWEATCSFLLLEGKGLMETTGQGVMPVKQDIGDIGGGGNSKLEKKKDKKKVMGKGTTIIMQFIKDRLQQFMTTNVTDSSVLPDKVAQFFLSFLDLKDPGFECLLQKVKDVVDSNESRRLPKLPKGTRDFAKQQMAVREKAFSIIGDVFKRHGAMALDTPVFELRETLTGKYGEDSKLIYDLADQGGELCSLRYDLTVPFARYVAMNGLTSFRRYQMAKVYRRDNPSKGRYREFYQCDFDIAGDETIGADFEVVKILTELLDELNIGDYEIKLNHRKLLDGMLDICGVPSEKVRTICSSIDKLDKQSFEHIKKEMIEEKGLNAETVDKIGSFVMLRGHPLKLLLELKKEGSEFLENRSSSLALNDLEKLFQALESARCIDKVILDLSLARGLDYYTGVIFEAVFKGATQVGSIAAGGRYDNLIGMFGTRRVPAVGVSLGIERVFTIMEQLQKEQNQPLRASETQILVSVLGDDISLGAKLVSRCWDEKLKAEYMVNKRRSKHFDRAKELGIPWMVIVGEREINEGNVQIKNMAVVYFVEELKTLMKNMEAKEDRVVSASNFVEELKTLMKNMEAKEDRAVSASNFVEELKTLMKNMEAKEDRAVSASNFVEELKTLMKNMEAKQDRVVSASNFVEELKTLMKNGEKEVEGI